MNLRWGIVPAAGRGTRIQPLAFSKELLPLGTWGDGARERPRAVTEYLLERMLAGGVNRICFVISPEKTDIIRYFGARIGEVPICYAVQQNPGGLCDALFSALPFVAAADEICVGLPDTVWYPVEGFRFLPDGRFSFLLFPTAKPELFDAVVTDHRGLVEEIQVKRQSPASRWVWGAFKLTGRDFSRLHELWIERRREDEYVGTLVNAYLAQGGTAAGIQRGEVYVDVGTLNGYREALRVLSDRSVIDELAS